MKKLFGALILVGSYLFTACVQADINPADLVKVTKDSKVKCVEYYNYRGDMYCSTKPLSPVDPKFKDYETQTIVFDDRPWQAAWGKKSDVVSTVEYVPAGEDINDWHELVTSQFFPGLQNKTTADEFANHIIQNIKDSGFKPIVTFFKTSPDVTIFEFRIESPENQIQDELQKVTRTAKGIYALHYTIKVSDMDAKKREAWLSNLSKSTVKKEV